RRPRGVGRIHASVGDCACALRLWRERAQGGDRIRPSSWSQAGGRGDRRPGGMGHGAYPLSRSGTRFDCGRRSFDCFAYLLLDRSDRGDHFWRRRWALALPPGSDKARRGAHVSAGLSTGRPVCACRILPASPWTPRSEYPDALPGRGVVRSVLSFRCPRLWGRTRGVAALARRDGCPRMVSDDVFLAGYGAAQAVPGPLFTFSAYLGAVMGPPPNGVAGAAISLVA